MKNTLTLKGLFTLILMIHNISLFSQDWILAKEKNGIKVYTRESNESPVKEFKAVTVIPDNIETIENIILGITRYSDWYDHCKKGEIVSVQQNGSTQIYIEYAMPFPFKNRDAVMNMSILKNTDIIIIRLSRNLTAVKEKDDIVRMPVSEGSWQLKKISDNKTEVIHQFKGDPAGNIPVSMVNLFLVDGPVNTLTQLKNICAGKK